MDKIKVSDKGLLGLEKGSFAEGLALMSMRGAIEPIKLNKQMKAIILTMISEMMERTSYMFEENDDYGLDKFLTAMHYLKQQLGEEKNLNRIKLDKKIGWTLCCFMADNRNHHLASENETEFENAMQWISHKVHKKYSHFELVRWSDEEPKKIKNNGS